MNGCFATLRSGQRSGQRCCRRIHDGGSFCGIHGGLSRSQARNRRDTFSVLSLDLRDIDLQDYQILLQDLSSLDTKKPSVVVELDFIDKFYCGICMEDVDSENAGCQLNCCKKGACTGCLQNWANESDSCPYCRAEIK